MNAKNIMVFIVFLLMILSISTSYAQTSLEKIGEEPSETFTYQDLNIEEVYTAIDDTYIYFKITVNTTIVVDSSNNKIWRIELDTDRDSRNSPSGWDDEYYILIILFSNSTEKVIAYDSSGNKIGNGNKIGGGAGSTYWQISVPKNYFNLGNAYYVQVITFLGSSQVDKAPYDNNNLGQTGDYYIYYISEPSITWIKTLTDDDVGTVTPSYLDLVYLKESYDTDNLYFQIVVYTSDIPWYGGCEAARYLIQLDTDNNPSTPTRSNAYDYQIEVGAGYVPMLQKYDIGQNLYVDVKRLDYLRNPGGKNTITIILPKSDIVNLANQIYMFGTTWECANQIDAIAEGPAPVPEYMLLALLVIPVALFFVYKKKKLEK